MWRVFCPLAIRLFKSPVFHGQFTFQHFRHCYKTIIIVFELSLLFQMCPPPPIFRRKVFFLEWNVKFLMDKTFTLLSRSYHWKGSRDPWYNLSKKGPLNEQCRNCCKWITLLFRQLGFSKHRHSCDALPGQERASCLTMMTWIFSNIISFADSLPVQA